MRPDTQLVRIGVNRDFETGSVTTPVYQTATYRHLSPDRPHLYDYTRMVNPTRQALEEGWAAFEGAAACLAYSSGMAALAGIFQSLRAGDHVIVGEDLYGGTLHLLSHVFVPLGLEASFVDITDVERVAEAWTPRTRLVLVETPTNPLLRVADIAALAELAHARGGWLVVDNTFLTPYLQRPLDLGADLTVYSATKFIGGHNDVLAGLVAVKDPDLALRLKAVQENTGAVLDPWQSWLLMRGIKTLAVRLERQCRTAQRLAEWLRAHPAVAQVYYPGLPDHPGYELARRQARGAGGMLAFRLRRPELGRKVLHALQVFLFAASLGGVESLATHPLTETHKMLPPEWLARLGIDHGLIRLSVGLEDPEDLMEDLDQALRNVGAA